jgi:hypothetical protein
MNIHPFPGEKQEARRPELLISNSDPTATAKALAALIAQGDDFLFNGHAPVRVVVEANCLPRALEVTTQMVRVLAHDLCIPTEVRIKRKARNKKDEEERTPVPLSNDIAQLYLYGLEGSWGLKPFQGITTAPILSSDGSIRIASGYDAASSLWCHNIPNIVIPAKPTEDEARHVEPPAGVLPHVPLHRRRATARSKARRRGH